MEKNGKGGFVATGDGRRRFRARFEDAKAEATRDFRSALRNWVTTLFGLGLLSYSLFTLFLSEYRGALDVEKVTHLTLFSLFGLFFLGAKDQEALDLARRVFFDMFGYWLSRRQANRSFSDWSSGAADCGDDGADEDGDDGGEFGGGDGDYRGGKRE